MILSHWAEQRLFLDDLTPREHHADELGMKPSGLWVSVDGEHDWESWCLSEMPQWIDKHYRHEVELRENANVMIIETVEALDAFSKEYATAKDGEDAFWHGYRLDWARLAKEADGIIISPYQRGCRLKKGFGWYSGWDCASGCIWNPEAIASISEGTLYRVR